MKGSTKRGLTRLWQAALILVLTAGACAPKATPETEAQAAEAPAQAVPMNVKTQGATLGALTEVLVVSGATLPARDVTFAAEIPGRIERLDPELGDAVSKGQVLARIDYSMLKAQRDQARAGLDLATKTLRRLTALRAEDLISDQQIDEVEAQRLNAKAAVDMAEVQLSRASVEASLSGVVVHRFAEEGEYANPGQPLLRVMDYDEIIVSAPVPEREVSRIKKGAPVAARIDALGKTVEGVVDVVVPAADPISRTYELRARIPNAERHIRVGMAVTLRLDVARHEQVIVVSQEVVVESGEERAVFVVEGDLAHRRMVVLGATEGSKVVIKAGLEAGDEVVTEGQRSLVDGQTVRVIKGEAKAPGATPPGTTTGRGPTAPRS